MAYFKSSCVISIFLIILLSYELFLEHHAQITVVQYSSNLDTMYYRVSCVALIEIIAPQALPGTLFRLIT